MIKKLVKKIKDFDDSLMEDVNKMEEKYKDENEEDYNILLYIIAFLPLIYAYYMILFGGW